MIQQILAISRNTFLESVRQPILLGVAVAATLLLVMSNPLSLFTMEDDQRMLIDLGLATIFSCGTVLAAFIATNVLGREIENRTVLTVVSKPVSRPVIVLGKYLGVAATLAITTVYMGLVFMLVEQHSVLQTVRDPVHVPVVVFGLGAVLLGIVAATWCNYFYGMVFSSSVLCITTPLLALAYLLCLNFGADFSSQPAAAAFKGQLWMALAALLVSILVLTAIAVAASTRLKQVMTLVVTVGFFLGGMLSDWFFGRRIHRLEDGWLQLAESRGLTHLEEHVRLVEKTNGEIEEIVTQVSVSSVTLVDMASGAERAEFLLCRIGRGIVPDFQVLWLSDALTQDNVIPLGYLAQVSLYGGLSIVAALAVAVVLFQRREVG